jgi:hypothetical protein
VPFPFSFALEFDERHPYPSPSTVMVVLGTTIHEFRGAGSHSQQSNSWILVPSTRMTNGEYGR